MSLNSESYEWNDAPFPRSTHNQWRCSGKKADKSKCRALLGLANADHSSVFIKRRDLSVFVYDLGGTGISVVCRQCGTINWLFSENISPDKKVKIKANQSIEQYNKKS